MHAAMRTKSPTSLALAFEQMRRGGALTFAEAMRTEFRIVSRIFEGHDFFEGVRAVLIDKDGAAMAAGDIGGHRQRRHRPLLRRPRP